MIARVFVCFLASAWLIGCATQPTPYQARTNGTGYAQQQLDSRTWRVQFAGNTNTPRETVENYLLYRSAEIMLSGGHDKFILLEKDIERNVDYRAFGYTPFYGFGSRYGYYYGLQYGPSFYGPVHYTARSSYAAVATIRAQDGEPAAAGAPVYDANELIQELGETIVLPVPDQG